MLININFDQLQEADDGDTTHYGGIVTVKNATTQTEVRATGSDRECNLDLDIIAAIKEILGRELTSDEIDSIDNKLIDRENFDISLS